MSKLPHILIFNPDQFRADALAHLGNPASVTPNLDRIAREDGISFENAYCQNPVCTPSRCSFMSGWYPHTNGHRIMHYMMHRDEPVLLRTLKENGYHVFWAGKNDLVPPTDFETCCDEKYDPARPDPDLHSFDDWRGDPNGDNYYSFYAGKLTPSSDKKYPIAGGASEHPACREKAYPRYDASDWGWVEGAAERIRTWKEDAPLCLYLPLNYPHPPYGVEEPWYSMVDREKIPARVPAPDADEASLKPSIESWIRKGQHLENWDETRFTELRGTYLGMCARIDEQFGILVQALKDAGIYDDTAIFVFSDHGDFTGDYGLVEKTQNTFEDCLTNVPFLIKPPASYAVTPGIRAGLVELTDFTATVEELTGIAPKHTHFGHSLVPAFADPDYAGRDAVFTEGGRLSTEEHTRENESLEGEEHPERRLYFPRLNAQVQSNEAHTKAVMCRTKEYKYVFRLYESDELYDLKKDPKEEKNLISDPAYQQILFRMKERMLCFMIETGDAVPHELDRR